MQPSNKNKRNGQEKQREKCWRNVTESPRLKCCGTRSFALPENGIDYVKQTANDNVTATG
jgi:hypothetical protein